MTITAVPPTDITSDREVRRYVDRHILLAVRRTVASEGSPPAAPKPTVTTCVLETPSSAYSSRRLRRDGFVSAEVPVVTAVVIPQDRQLPDFWDRSFTSL